MMFGIVLSSVAFLIVFGSVYVLVRDVRGLHRGGRSLTDSQVDAAGVSPAAMVWQSNMGAR